MNAQVITASKPQTFKALLQEELISRCRKNPRYSLRSFAKSLNVSPSALSDMLKGKRAITAATVEKLGLALGLNLSEIELFIAAPKTDESSSRTNFQQIAFDQYALIADWYHYAILELTKIRSFEITESSVAKALGITKAESNIAIERLFRMELLGTDASGKIVDTSDGFSTNISGNLTSAASRQLQKQILEKSIDSLLNDPIELRNHTSMTMAIDPLLLPEAIERIKKFRRELCEFLEMTSTRKEVFQLSISLFPSTHISNSGDKI